MLSPADELRLPDNQKDAIASAAKTINASKKRVMIQAYAGSAGEEQARAARKIALARGMAVRNALIDQGVDMLRINVQVNVGKPGTDRVDLVME